MRAPRCLSFPGRNAVGLPQLIVASSQVRLPLTSEYTRLKLGNGLHRPAVGELQVESLVECRPGPFDDRGPEHVKQIAPFAMAGRVALVLSPRLHHADQLHRLGVLHPSSERPVGASIERGGGGLREPQADGVRPPGVD